MVIDVWSCELLGARGLFLPVRPCSLLSVRPIIKYHSFTICFRLLNESKAERVTSFPSELYLLVIKQCYWASFVPCVAKPASFPFYNCTIRAGALLSYISRPCACVRVCACVLKEREREGKIRCSQRLLKCILFSLAARFCKMGTDLSWATFSYQPPPPTTPWLSLWPCAVWRRAQFAHCDSLHNPVPLPRGPFFFSLPQAKSGHLYSEAKRSSFCPQSWRAVEHW